MDFFSIPLIINDRREKIINLYSNQKEITVFKHLVETHRNAHFHLIEFQHDTEIKSFVPHQNDLKLADLQSSYELVGNNLTITLKEKEHIPQPIQEPIEPKEEENPIYSYEDLELFKSAPKKERITQQNTIETIQSNSEVVGVLRDTIKIIATRYSNGAVLLSGYVMGNFEDVLQANFPDLLLHVVMQIKGKEFANSTNISFAHPEQFLGIALDFGSEASQMAIKRYQQDDSHQHMRPEIENLFKNILSYNKAKNWIAHNEHTNYYQEERNTNFYKSIFFLRENLTGNYEDIYRDLYIADQPDNLKMLVNTYDGYKVLMENKYHQLPNLKITQKYDNLFQGINFNINKEGYDINIGLGTVKNKVYNSILKTMIASFLKKEFLLQAGATRKIRFILLVPNIYDYFNIKSTQNILNNIFQSLADNEYKGRLLSWEILTISESDASFLGYINKNDIQIEKNKEYIVIDSGKGTTDLSIIRTGKHNVYNIKPIYRNGFAGAGNLITFAVFETILHYIRAHASSQNSAFVFIKEKIIDVLNSDNLEVKNNIFEQIERLKFKYHDNTAYVLSLWKDASVGDTNFSNITEEGRANITSTLKDLLSNISNISDFYGYIQGTCTAIATRAIQNIKLVQKNADQFNCAGIILSGRAFMFKPYEDIMRKMIQEELNVPSSKIHLLNGNELKDICIKGVFNNSIRINAEKIGYPIQIISKQYKTQEEAPQVVNNNQQGAKNTIKSKLLKLFFNELNDLEEMEAVIPTSNTELQYKNLAKSQILIGGKRYKIIGNTMYNEHQGIQESANLLFTEKGFLVRKLENGIVTNVYELQEIFDTEDVELNMVIPSLFPNYIDEQFIDVFQKTIDLQTETLPINFDIQAPKDNSSSNNNLPKGPIYF